MAAPSQSSNPISEIALAGFVIVLILILLLEMPNWDIERYGVSEDKMLRFCLNYGVAAALMPARNILLSNDASVQSKRMAAKICERLASPLPSSLPASGVTNCVEQGKEKCP